MSNARLPAGAATRARRIVRTSFVGIAANVLLDFTVRDRVAFEDLPADWVCPRCMQPTDKYNRA